MMHILIIRANHRRKFALHRQNMLAISTPKLTPHQSTTGDINVADLNLASPTAPEMKFLCRPRSQSLSHSPAAAALAAESLPRCFAKTSSLKSLKICSRHHPQIPFPPHSPSPHPTCGDTLGA